MNQDLSLNELLHDPMIRMMLRADRVSLPKFAVILQDAARRQSETVAQIGGRSTATTRQSSPRQSACY